MIKVSICDSIRTLHEQGTGIRQIARQLHVSRNTVRRHLKSVVPSGYDTSQRSKADFAPFRDTAQGLLAQNLIGSRILTDLRKQGYSGPAATFYRQLSRLKEQILPPEAIERFETAPGRQGQYDWSEYVVCLGGCLTKIYVSSLILGFSRYQHFHVTLDITQQSIFEALEAGFRHLGGVPQEILFDNPKSIVTQPKPNLRWNRRFLEFASFYGFDLRACWPGRPQTKGKVERPFFVLEQHFIKGHVWPDFVGLVYALLAFEQERAALIHGTTRQTPRERFEQERLLLRPLPEARFIPTQGAFRNVSQDCMVSFAGSRYSVPWQYAGKSVWVRTRGARLEVYSQAGVLLTDHELSDQRGSVTTRDEHYEGLRQRPPHGKTVAVEVFRRLFPEAESIAFLNGLLAQYKFNATWHLRRILELVRRYPKAAFPPIFAKALSFNTYSCHFIRGLLQEAQSTEQAKPVIQPPLTRERIPEITIQRELTSYQTLIDWGQS